MKRAVFIIIAGLLISGCSKSGSQNASSTSSTAPAGGSSGGSAAAGAMVGPAVATAKSAVAGIISALQSGSASAVKSVFATQSPMQKSLVAAEAKLVSLKNTVERSIRFNAPAPVINGLVSKIAPTGGILPTVENLNNSSVVVNGATAVVNQGKNLSKLFLSKVGANWKIDLQKTISAVYPDASTAEAKLKGLTASLGKATDFLQQVQTGVANGSIKSLSDIEMLAAKFEGGSIPGVANVTNLMNKF